MLIQYIQTLGNIYIFTDLDGNNFQPKNCNGKKNKRKLEGPLDTHIHCTSIHYIELKQPKN